MGASQILRDALYLLRRYLSIDGSRTISRVKNGALSFGRAPLNFSAQFPRALLAALALEVRLKLRKRRLKFKFAVRFYLETKFRKPPRAFNKSPYPQKSLTPKTLNKAKNSAGNPFEKIPANFQNPQRRRRKKAVREWVMQSGKTKNGRNKSEKKRNAKRRAAADKIGRLKNCVGRARTLCGRCADVVNAERTFRRFRRLQRRGKTFPTRKSFRRRAAQKKGEARYTR